MSLASSPTSIGQSAASHASLILVDDEVDITTDRLADSIKKAYVNVEPVGPSLFAKVLEGKSVKNIFAEPSKPCDKNGGEIEDSNKEAYKFI